MRNVFYSLLLVIVTACAGNPYYISKVGNTYYTKSSLFRENGRYMTTNYHRGLLLPANSEVVVKKMNRKSIIVEIVSSKEQLTVVNVPKHTADSIREVFDKILSPTAIDLSKFSKLERKNIESGTVEIGMTRDAVLVAMGYPPAVKTPNLTSDVWVYWISKFDKTNVYFKDDKVVEVKK